MQLGAMGGTDKRIRRYGLWAGGGVRTIGSQRAKERSLSVLNIGNPSRAEHGQTREVEGGKRDPRSRAPGRSTQMNQACPCHPGFVASTRRTRRGTSGTFGVRPARSAGWRLVRRRSRLPRVSDSRRKWYHSAGWVRYPTAMRRLAGDDGDTGDMSSDLKTLWDPHAL